MKEISMPVFVQTKMVILVLTFITGMCVGSFLNVMALRGISKESIIFPNSKCPNCQVPLYWWHKIPVLSYLLLKGKCWFCKKKISMLYPFTELLTGVLFVLALFKFALTINFLFILAIISGLIVLAITDLKSMTIVGWHAYLLTGIGLFYNIYNHNFLNSILGIILGLGLFFIIAKTCYLISKKKSFGEGDFLISMALGSFFTIKLLPFVLISSIILGACLTFPQFIKNLFIKKEYLTLVLLTIFIVFSALIYKFSLPSTSFTKYVILAVYILLAIFTCRRILNTSKSSVTKVPFGPAMSISALIYIFFVF